MPLKPMVADAKGRMRSTVDTVLRELGTMRTGRASVAMLDTIRVDYYGTPTPLNQVGNLAVPDPTLITLQPWDPSLLPAIEKAIRTSDLDLNPQNDGKIIRIPVPSLTEERRKNLVKVAHKHAEEGRVADPQRPPRRERAPQEAPQGARRQRGRREAGPRRGAEAHRPAHRGDQRGPQEEGSGDHGGLDIPRGVPSRPPRDIWSVVRCPFRLSRPSGPRESPDEDRPPALAAAPPRPAWPRPPVQIRDEPGRAALLLAGTGCIENRVSVELFTQIHGDGTCTRRVEYRLERVDTDKGDARVEIRPEDDVLLRWHRFPSGEPWQVREERETGLHVIVVEALLPSPAAADGDFYRARAPRAQPARNIVSAFVDAEHGAYEYQEVLRDPSSPLAAARALSRAALKRDGDLRRGLRATRSPARARARASPTCDARTGSGSPSPSRGRSRSSPSARSTGRARGATSTSSSTASTRSRRTSRPGSRPSPRALPPEEIEAAAEASFNSLGKGLLEQLEEAGLPLLTARGAGQPSLPRHPRDARPDPPRQHLRHRRHGGVGVRGGGPLRPRLRDEGARLRALTL